MSDCRRELASGITCVRDQGLGAAFIQQIQTLQPALVLTVGYTGTVQNPGLSAAGATPLLRDYTAAADAEIVAMGRSPSVATGVPSHPDGIPGPVIITRAALNQLSGIPITCIDAGCRFPPQIATLVRFAGAGPADCLSSGHALSLTDVSSLWAAAYAWGSRMGQQYQAEGRYVILAESVPGGTTTALAVLLALGIDAEYRVSSSLVAGAHAQKLALVAQGLAAAGGRKGSFRQQPLTAIAAVGDPMQPVVAALALACSQWCPVLLGGGTQMVAVLALLTAMGSPGVIALATTRWVARDPAADLAGLGGLLAEQRGGRDIPYYAVDLNFSTSRFPALRRYEEGYVKEGVGAGAITLAACLARSCHPLALLPEIERVFVEFYPQAVEAKS